MIEVAPFPKNLSDKKRSQQYYEVCQEKSQQNGFQILVFHLYLELSPFILIQRQSP